MLRFVHISDTHLSPDRNYSYSNADYPSWRGAEALVRQLNSLPFTPDFVLHTGDVAYDPVPEAYEVIQELVSQIRYPVYYIAGNHDDGAMVSRILMNRDTDNPLYYEFDVNGVQILCLDSNAPGQPPPAGRIDAEQLAWVRDVCRVDDPRPLVVAIHHNPLKTGIPWLDEYMGMVNGDDLHHTLLPLRDRIRGVFHGHIHMNFEVLRDGILYTSVLSSWYQLHAYPNQTETEADRNADPGFNVVTVTEQQTLIRRHRFSMA